MTRFYVVDLEVSQGCGCKTALSTSRWLFRTAMAGGTEGLLPAKSMVFRPRRGTIDKGKLEGRSRGSGRSAHLRWIETEAAEFFCRRTTGDGGESRLGLHWPVVLRCIPGDGRGFLGCVSTSRIMRWWHLRPAAVRCDESTTVAAPPLRRTGT
jgi:hypothetical protein